VPWTTDRAGNRTWQWEFSSSAQRPAAANCRDCGAWHGMRVHRVKGSRCWVPEGGVSAEPAVHGRAEVVEIDEGGVCGRCVRKQNLESGDK
jgi:hypothetical protein